MRVLLLEDDYLQADLLRAELKRVLGAEVLWIDVESDVLGRQAEIDKFRPHVALIDVMLRWATPHDEPPPPPLPAGWSLYTAGLRCREYLAARPATRSTPMIFYTVLSETDVRSKLPGYPGAFPAGVHFLGKDSDPDPLIQLIREVTGPGGK